ncbi:MAG TPA: phage portal protein [Pyrinomonadaceae bacterium]|nr:phage portal protein [Pyrinomonadaceae bacterium]
MEENLERLINALRTNGTRAARYERYYDGRHDLRFATDKFANTFGELFREFALNLCPVVCDAVRDKLRITGFSVESGEVESTEQMTRHIWQRARMNAVANQIHKEALKTGDAYAIVWPNDRGKAHVFAQNSANIAVEYSLDEPNQMISAMKWWIDENKYARANMFYADRIERYISRSKVEGYLPAAKDLIAISDGVTANPFGIVPVFHFANNADIGGRGRSELDPVIPIQDGLNKSSLDMLVAMEFAAFRQRWATGIEVEYNADGKPIAPFTTGVDSLWVAGDSTARFGDFAAAELEQFLKVKDSFRADIASVSATPLHYFLQDATSFPSGESLRQASSRFTAKVRDRQAAFGEVWADVMAFALRVDGYETATIVTQWEDPSPMSEREMLENLVLKRQLGLGPEDALIEAGYGAGDVKQMTNDKEENEDR